MTNCKLKTVLIFLNAAAELFLSFFFLPSLPLQASVSEDGGEIYLGTFALFIKGVCSFPLVALDFCCVAQ